MRYSWLIVLAVLAGSVCADVAVKGSSAYQTSSLRLWYKLGESGSSSPVDYSGNGYNGVAFNTSSGPGVFGNGTRFNGSSRVISRDEPTFINSSMSVSFWVNISRYPASSAHWVIEKGLGDTRGFRTIIWNDGYIYGSMFNVSSGVCQSRAMSSLNVWDNYVWVSNNSHIVMYKNGVMAESTFCGPNFISQASGNLSIGHLGGYSVMMNGSLDDIQLYNRSLSASEVLKLYQSGISESVISSPANMSVFVLGSGGDSIGGFPIVNVSGSGVVGFPDNSSRNISIFHAPDPVTVLMNTSGIFAYDNGTTYSKYDSARVNATHWSLSFNLTYPSRMCIGAGPFGSECWEVLGPGLRNLTVRSCGGYGLVSCYNSTIFFNVTTETDVYTYYPAAGGDYASPLNPQCNVSFSSYKLESVSYSLYNSSGFLVASNSTPPSLSVGGTNWGYGAGVFVFDSLNLSIGAYSYSCRACDNRGDCVETVNTSFTVGSYAENPSTFNGDCTTEKAYSYSFTADPSSDWVVFNMSGLGAYVLPNLLNVLVDSPALTYRVGSDSLAVRTSSYKTFTLWIGSYGFNHSYTSASVSPDESYSLTLADFALSPSARAYFIFARNESNNVINYAATTSSYVDVLCPTYAPERVDLKAWNRTAVFLAVKESPEFTLTASYPNTYVRRTLTPESGAENLTFYLPSNSSVLNIISVVLQDYTGLFSNAYLKLYQNINGSLRVIWRESIPREGITNIPIVNGTFVRFEVQTDQDTINYGWSFIVGGGQTTLSISQPSRSHHINHYAGLSFEPLYDYAAGVVGFSYAVEDGGVNLATFRIRNTSEEVIYEANATTDSATFTQGVPVNFSYSLELVLDVENHSVLSFAIPVNLDYSDSVARTFQLVNTSAIGVSESLAKSFAVFAVITGTGFLASPTTAGFIAFAIVGELIVFYLLNFLPGLWPLILLTGMFAFTIKLTIDRKYGGES